MQTDSAKLQDFAARYTAAWCSQNRTRVAECYSVTGSTTINHGTPAVGQKAIAEVARSFMTAFPDMRVIIDKLLFEGDRTEYHGTLIGTNTGLEGREHRVRSSGFERWRMRSDALIACSQGNRDTAEYPGTSSLTGGIANANCAVVFPDHVGHPDHFLRAIGRW